jgi:conjugal transfer/entry exclusion protein
MPVVQQMVSDSMNTYYNAWNIADEVQGNMDSDDSALASIEQVNQSLGGGILGGGGASLLAAVQLVVETSLHINQELQYANELHAVEIKMHAIEHAENLDERAQAHITETTAQNWGSTPQ